MKLNMRRSGNLLAPILLVPILFAAFAFQPAQKAPVSDPQDFAFPVRRVMKEFCFSCHSGAKAAAKLDLTSLPADFRNPAIAAQWKEVVNALSAHQMPPKGNKQPSSQTATKMVETISAELAKVEIEKRSKQLVLRRLNRSEYNNTIRDLVGIDRDHAKAFPEDPPAGGFDNIGQALSLSPLQIELYYSAARDILDHALVDGPQPATIKWHFEPEENKQGMDAYRVQRDNQRSIILNDGANPTEEGFTVVHHESWDKNVDLRNFNLPSEGEYIIRLRAASRVPSREQVVESARKLLARRRDQQNQSQPNGKRYHGEQYERDLAHFVDHRMYSYGPARVRMVQHLAGTPINIGELDIDASKSAPKIFEVRQHFTTQSAGINFHYDYSLPAVLENNWMQRNDAFARPELLIDWIEIEGPIHREWPPKSHEMILISSPNKGKDEAAYARDIIASFMARAYRRPVTAQEIATKLKVFQRERSDKSSFIEAIKMPLAAILTSPNFLFLVEPDPANKGRKLNEYELATRLSYFLWSSMPDETLLQAAAKGALSKPEGLTSQVNRMLADRKSETFVKNFAGQWLGLRKVGANPPVANLYPEYDRHLEVSLVRESEGFFREILKNDLDARNLIKSDFVTINERLARFYAIPDVRGDEIRKVAVPAGVRRGGVMTQASVLSITSNGTRTSPVSRGVWILRTLLGSDPGLPVANVGEIASKVPGIDRATVRQRLQIHRENPSCARCHDKIDPIGFSLENYNAAGEWRTQEGHGYQGRIERNDPVIDASSLMPDGTAISGVEGLQNQLLRQEDAFLNHLATQIATYAVGRELGFSDQPQVRDAVTAMKRQKYSLRALIVNLVNSRIFQWK